MKNVLVTGVGGPTPRSFVRAVQSHASAAGLRIRFIGVDCNPLAYGLYATDLFEKTHLVPPVSSPSYWPALLDIIQREKIEAAVVLPEVEVLEWASNLQRIPASVKTHLPDIKLAQVLVDKSSLHTALEATDFIPKHIRVERGVTEFGDVCKSLGVQFWIRSATGSSGLGSLLVTDESSFKNWLTLNSAIPSFIATEYLPGRNLACKLLYFNNRLVRTACAERVTYIMSKVAPSGITGNTAFGRLINEPKVVELSEKALELLSMQLSVSLNGIYTVDLKEDLSGVPRITEINVRHVAFTQVLAAAGANIPMDTIRLLLAPEVFDQSRIDYQFDSDLIFLRDVDERPIILRESQLLGLSDCGR